MQIGMIIVLVSIAWIFGRLTVKHPYPGLAGKCDIISMRVISIAATLSALNELLALCR